MYLSHWLIIRFANEQIVGVLSLKARVYDMVIDYLANLYFKWQYVFGRAYSLGRKGEVLWRSAFELLQFGGDEQGGGADDLCDLFLNVGLFSHEIVQNYNCQMVCL